MPDTEIQTLVIRELGEDDDYAYRLAKMPSYQVDEWGQRLSGGGSATDVEIGRVFGPKLDLSEAMEAIDTRDFTVVDLPS